LVKVFIAKNELTVNNTCRLLVQVDVLKSSTSPSAVELLVVGWLSLMVLSCSDHDCLLSALPLKTVAAVGATATIAAAAAKPTTRRQMTTTMMMTVILSTTTPSDEHLQRFIAVALSPHGAAALLRQAEADTEDETPSNAAAAAAAAEMVMAAAAAAGLR
jgi:hypothetical protein